MGQHFHQTVKIDSETEEIRQIETCRKEAETTVIQGGAFIEGTRTFLAWGSQGLGSSCYGTGAECSDPCSPYQGTHAYPYECAIFLFDINDLIDVKNGIGNIWDPVFYNRLDGLPFAARGEAAPGPVGTPGQDDCFNSYQHRCWYDPSDKRFYVNDNGSTDCHVYQVTV